LPQFTGTESPRLSFAFFFENLWFKITHQIIDNKKPVLHIPYICILLGDPDEICELADTTN